MGEADRKLRWYRMMECLRDAFGEAHSEIFTGQFQWQT